MASLYFKKLFSLYRISYLLFCIHFFFFSGQLTDSNLIYLGLSKKKKKNWGVIFGSFHHHHYYIIKFGNIYVHLCHKYFLRTDSKASCALS